MTLVMKEAEQHGWEIEFCLGQSSKFSLILVTMALRLKFIGDNNFKFNSERNNAMRQAHILHLIRL